MKRILILALLGIVPSLMFSQNSVVLFKAKVAEEKVPTSIVEAVETDFPGYAVVEYSAAPVEFVDGDVYVDTDVDPNAEYDTYQVAIKNGTNEEASVTYDANGKLLSAREHLKNVAPPELVRESIAATFPGWTLEKDSYKLTQYKNKLAKDSYKLVLSKKGKTMKVYTNSYGDILKVK